MSLSISSTGSFSSIPSSSEMNSFSDGLKNASTQDLLGALGKSGAEPWQKDAIMKELQNRAQEGSKANGDNGGAGDSPEDIQKLLKKLQDGTITPEELQKLAGMLGVDPNALEALKGKGSGTGTGDTDIQGG